MRISDWSSDVCSSDLFFIQFHAGVFESKTVRLRPTTCGEKERIACNRLTALHVNIECSIVILYDFFKGRVEAEHYYFVHTDLEQTIANLQIGRASCRERVCRYV